MLECLVIRSAFYLRLMLLGVVVTRAALSVQLQSGTNLEVRLLAAAGSRASHPGDALQAVVISPVFEDGRIIIPQGALLAGHVGKVHRIGYGVLHSTASVEMNLESLTLPGQLPVPVQTRLLEIETAKERVKGNGLIGGIHPSANFSSGVSILISALMMQPAFAVPALGVKFLIARSPDPEIYLPAGTEMIVQVTAGRALSNFAGGSPTPLPLSSQDTAQARHLLNSMPHQQSMRNPKMPSDLANVLILGNRDQIERAFQAAGWTGAQGHTALALYRMYNCMVMRVGYLRAPMMRLTLNGAVPQATFQKSLDTFAKRHHIRLWNQSAPDVWMSAATEDRSFAVRQGLVTHVSDPYIDNERAKVINDLAMTGCVEGASLLARNGLQIDQDARNEIVTDGQIAVLRLNDCHSPANVIPVEHKPVASRIGRISLVVAKDFARSNPVTLGSSVMKLIFAPGSKPGPETTQTADLQANQVRLLARWKRPNAITLTPAFTGYTAAAR